jgi:carbon starvation protein CstA
MAWSNQTLATIVLWAITIYLAVERKLFWITLIPAVFMSAVIIAYILVAPEGFNMNVVFGQLAGVCISFILFIWFLFWKKSAKIFLHSDVSEKALESGTESID